MIGNDSNCDHDYLEFRVGTEDQDPVFAKFCNTSHPSPLFSPGASVLVHFHSDASANYPGFQITYSVVEGMPGCGGAYTRHQDEIRSPSFSGNYPNDIQCEYKIQLPEKTRIRITFLSFDVEDAAECQFDYVAIHAGGNVDAPLMGKYCGSVLPAPFIAESNVLLIVFKTDWATTQAGFVLKYETVCGGKYTQPTGVVQSPGYPNKYDHSLECIYEIIQPLGKIIKLRITDLDMESNSYPECMYDFLEIRDGHDQNSTLVGTYCEVEPPMIVSSYNYLWMKFQTDANNNGRGFTANYTTSDLGCGGIMKEKSGTFSTPSYPEVYAASTTCKWIISAPPQNVIQIIWMNFQLEKSFDCSYDYVEIFDNNTETGEGSSIGKYCGQSNPPTILSTSNLVTIVFESDQTYNQNGFLASYNFILESNVCGGNYYTDAGVLKSPKYPENYPLNIECKWTIQVKPGHQIMLNVTDFSLEKFSICRYDFLEIRNGGSSTSPLLGVYCGTTIPKLIPSHANKLYIYFKSDMTKAERGFKIKWSATATGCGGTLTSPTGSLISPNYPEPYSVNTECIWKISISTGSLIQIVFSDIDLEENVECLLDYVEILDGPSLNSKSLGRFCTSHSSFIRSTGNSVTVKFRSDLSRNGRGFQLQYTTMCNNTLTGFRGVIESPNFPNNYPNSANCNWEIKVAQRNKVNISFSHFDLEKDVSQTIGNTSQLNNCVYDFVEVLYIEPVSEYEDEGPFQKYGAYCGDQLPPLISLNSNHAKIHFVTDSHLHGNGFRLEWQIDGCGDVLTRPNGNIMSPNYPHAYPPSIECNWKIQVDFGNHIEITFQKVELEKTFICHLDYIKLYNGEDETYPEIASICHQNKPITLRSSGNFMFVKFKADSSVQGTGFYANYTTKPTKCGGKYAVDKAKIMSPNYPQNYEKNDTCGYEIEITEGYMIELKFEDFDLFYKDGVDCASNNDSYVKVYDGPNIKYPVLAKVCGKSAPNGTILSTTNKMYIEMVTFTDEVAKGFLAEYKRSCGARIETDGTGIIRMNPTDLDYDEYNCTWTIVSKDPTKHVSLTITHLDTMNYCDENSKSLKIYNGASSDAPLLGAYCGTKVPPTLTTDGSAMHIDIEYNSELFATYSVYDSHCGGTLTSLEGFFASPGYPKKYPIDTECEWTISISEGNHVSLSFSYFELLESENCNTDYLEVRQDNSGGKLMGTFCGDDLPTNITHRGSLWIFLKTSRVDGDTSGVTAKGFYAEYYLNRNNELSGPSGKIVSPLHHQDSSLYGDFSWKISVNFGKRLLLTFKEINLESGDSMCFASLYVYDGPDIESPLIKEFCGSTIPDAIGSTSNMLFIRFSGYSSTRSISRFTLEWMEVNAKIPPANSGPKPKGCGTTEPISLNGVKNFTIIRSPGYPDGYGPDLNCEWILTTSPMNRIRIKFTNMDLIPSFGTNCYGDYVELFEKKIDADWMSVMKICNENITSQSFIYTSNMLKLVFKSDRFRNRTGFQALIREACGGSLQGPNGYIIFDNVTREGYGRLFNVECEWNITARAGRTIEIEFLSVDIHYDENKGCNNYLMFRNGQFPDSPVLGNGKYCGNQMPKKLTTTGNKAYVKYKGVANLGDFKLRYREISYACGGDITLTQFDNVIEVSSPNYPQIPPPHIECLWRISAPPGEIIRIDFPYRFDLAFKADCSDEYLELRDGGTVYSKPIGKFCGAKPSSQFSTDNMMFIKFFTEKTEPGNGFKAKLTLSNCGGTIHGRTGQIQSPFFNVPSKYPMAANCTWHVITPHDHNMDLKFKKIDLEDRSYCSAVDHVRIYEKNEVDNGETTLGVFCGKTIPATIQSSGNEALINFVTSTTKKEHNGFSLQFNASLEECGGTIEAAEGTFQSPEYPSPHKGFRRCGWFIKVPKGRRVSLKFEDFDMNARISNSWLSGLQIFNYDKYRGFIKRITADTANKSAESSSNTMFVFYWSTGASGRGFKAKFTSNQPSVCGGDLNQESGTITQPNIGYNYYCNYIRNRPLSSTGTTLAMTLTTSTNVTKSGSKISCFRHIALFKLNIEDGKESITLANCVPSKTFVRIPYQNIELQTMQFNTRNQVNYSLSYNTYQCGGIVTGEMGTIKSPGFPNKYSKSMECSWLLKLPAEQTILITFDNLDLGENCEKSYIDLYNGGSPNSPKIERICQNNKPDPIQSETNKLWIDYKFDQDSSGKGFSLHYEPKIQGCGGVFHDRSRILQSPSFPNDYPNNAECLWELRSDEGYHIGLSFTTRFQIEQTENCENDFLEIWDWRNNDWYSLGKKCGREFPNTINSTSNRMRLLFRSNDRIAGKGFRAQWEWNCGGTFIADNTERFVISPGFPIVYKRNLKCQYNISSDNRMKFVNIRFEHFDLEGVGSNCKFDNLTISNEFNQMSYRHLSYYKQIFCGQKGPPAVRLMNTIYILFQTDKWMEKSGFKFSYQLDDCGGNITAPTTIEKSLNFIERTPGMYSSYINCMWNITAPRGKTVIIEFQDFKFQFRRGCYYDNIEIYEGSAVMRNNRIANLCGNLTNNPPVVKSENNSVLMTLKTDLTIGGSFKAEILFADGPAVGCGGKISLNSTMTLTSPNLLDMDCSWVVRSTVGTNIKVHFDELNLPATCGLTNHTRRNCDCASLEVRDGYPAVGSVIIKYCGTSMKNLAREITSSGNILGMRLRTTGATVKAFKVTLTAVNSICGPVYLNANASVQILTSPGYPNKYPSNLRCTWVIKGSFRFSIQFLDFDLNEETDHVITNACGEDRLEIVDDTDPHVLTDGLGPSFTISGNKRTTSDFSRYSLLSGTHQFCGKSEKPFDYHGNMASLVVKFSSGNLDKNRGKGFKLQYQSAGCNRNYTSLQGRIFTSFESNCYQTITVPNNYTISVYFQQLVLYQSNNCDKSGTEIRDGSDKGASLMKICGYALPNPVFSSTNKLWIHSWSNMGNRWPANIDLIYTSSDQGRGCGGTLYNYKGSFTSPFYPNGYKNSTPCVWDVRVPIGMRVAIKLTAFDIQGDCDRNYVKVTTFEKEEANDHKFCRTDTPAALYSSSHLLVTYQSSTSNGGTGWSAQFEAVSQ